MEKYWAQFKNLEYIFIVLFQKNYILFVREIEFRINLKYKKR